MRRLIAGGGILGAVLFCSVALAGDLVGEWQAVAGKHSGALSGSTDHGLRPSGDHYSSGIPWVLKITRQEGSGFHGQWCSPKKCEPLLGVIRKDGSMLMVDEDSTFFATLYGDEMEVCVTENGTAFRVATCLMMKKK